MIKALVFSLLVASQLAAAPALAVEWEKVGDADGVLIERKPLTGSSLYEIRASMRCPVPPAQFFEVIWQRTAYLQFVPYLQSVKILSQTADSIVAYETVKMPIVKDRDYTTKITKVIDPQTQLHQLFFESSDQGPGENSDYVRVTGIKGSWTLEPIDNGQGTEVTYIIASDPGGALPKWIVNLAQKDAPRNFLLAMMKRALSLAPTRRKSAT